MVRAPACAVQPLRRHGRATAERDGCSAPGSRRKARRFARLGLDRSNTKSQTNKDRRSLSQSVGASAKREGVCDGATPDEVFASAANVLSFARARQHGNPFKESRRFLSFGRPFLLGGTMRKGLLMLGAWFWSLSLGMARAKSSAARQEKAERFTSRRGRIQDIPGRHRQEKSGEADARRPRSRAQDLWL